MLTKGVLALGATVALVACGSAAASQKSSSGVLGAKQSTSGTLITLHKTKLGKVLATSSGLTLYMYKPDTKNHSNCYTGCAGFWPPLTVKGKLRAGTGVKAKLFGVAMRKNGAHQATYAGHPLYRYTGDSKSGQTKGEGYQSIWWVLNSSGKAVKRAPAAGSTSNPTTTSPYPGY